jgi:protein SYS1
MTSLGVWVCRYRELQPISFGGNTIKTNPDLANGTIMPEEHVRAGRGRGRNMDAGPSYEMVGMKSSDDAV